MVAWGGEPVRLGGDWSRKGNRKGETLCLLLSSIFNASLGAEPFHDNADIALGRMALARGTANIADQPFGWYPHGWGGGFLAYLHSPLGYGEPEILRYSNHQFRLIGADAGHHLPSERQTHCIG